MHRFSSPNEGVRGAGERQRLARSCSSLIAHLDPADVIARVCQCVLARAQRRGGGVGGGPRGFVVKCWTFRGSKAELEVHSFFGLFIYLSL